MDELLKKLLAADILTEDVKTELELAFNVKLTEAIEVAQAAAQAKVTAELNEQWINERETLIDALDAKVTEALTDEMSELREDIERFRDLETEYAEKLVEAKSEMADVLKSDIIQLIEKMDAFFEIRLTTELAELREDMQIVRRNEFGRNIFEAFVTEFKKHYAGDDSIESKLNEAETRLEDALTALEESEKTTAKLKRKIKMEKVLTPLSGRTREVMEAILKNVDTALIDDAYQTYIGRVLKETSVSDIQTSEKENKVLAEGKTTKQKVQGVAKTGNDEDRIVTEQVQEQADTTKTFGNTNIARIKAIAGI